MLPIIVLVSSLLVFRGLGVLGVPLFRTWHDAAPWALCAMVLVTASAHVTALKEDLIKMVPTFFPAPRQIVLVTGLLELAGAAGLLIPQVRTEAAICLALLFVALVPANINASLQAGSPARQERHPALAGPPDASALHRFCGVDRARAMEDDRDAPPSRNVGT